MNPAEFDALCRLARLALTDEEKLRLRGQMEAILTHVDKLNGADVSGVEPMGHASGLENAPREDAARASLSPEEALANAPKRAWNFFAVPQVMED